MLVLSRQLNEAVIIGDDVEITILEIKGNTVRLGIDAPQDVSVHRSEIYVQIKREEHIDASMSCR